MTDDVKEDGPSTALNVNQSEVVEQEVLSIYDLPITKGQYWLKHKNVIAFVLELSEFAVIFQNKITIGPHDSVVFDFPAGQDLMTTSMFRKYLQERESTLVELNQETIDITLKAYHNLKANGEILKPLILPETEEDMRMLSDLENYKTVKRIVPPPMKYRNRKGLHWLKVGVSGEQLVCKLWDPNADRNPNAEKKLGEWVMPNGLIDPQAVIGIVNDYHAPVDLNFDDSEFETVDQFVTRVIDFLKSKNILFGEANMLKQLQAKLKKTIEKENLCPCFQFVYWMSETKTDKVFLHIGLTINQKMEYELRFSDIQNRTFIPNDALKLITF